MDQALVSLVDKEKMRVKQANILEVLKVWMKSSAAERSGLAAASAEALATQAKADNKVRALFSLFSPFYLILSIYFVDLFCSYCFCSLLDFPYSHHKTQH